MKLNAIFSIAFCYIQAGKKSLKIPDAIISNTANLRKTKISMFTVYITSVYITSLYHAVTQVLDIVKSSVKMQMLGADTAYNAADDKVIIQYTPCILGVYSWYTPSILLVYSSLWFAVYDTLEFSLV